MKSDSISIMKNKGQTKLERFTSLSRIFQIVFTSKFLYLLGLMGILLFIASIWNRFIYIDDAFFGEQALSLARHGIVRTTSLIDFLGCDIQLFSYHKLNIFVGAGLIKLFGWSITPLRLSTLIFLCALCFVFWRYFKNNVNAFTNKHFIVATFFLLVSPLILLYGYTYRPEIWVAFFGFTSYFLLDRFLSKNGNLANIVFSGVCAGLAFLTHLNGLIFPAAGFILLVVYRKYKEAFIFSIVAGFICLFYFWDLWQPGHLQAWLYQLKNWPDNNATNYMSSGIVGLLKNVGAKLLSEHQRFFWSYKVWGISFLFFTSLLFNFKYLLKEYRSLIIYTFSLILVLNIAGSQIAERFLIYHLPFMSIIISIGILRLLDKWRGGLAVTYLILLLAQVVFFTKMAVDIFKRNDSYIAKHESLFSKIPDKTQLILVPYQFVFNALDSCKLATFKGFEYYEKGVDRVLTQQEVFARADSMGIKYIIVPRDGLRYESTSMECFEGKPLEHSTAYMLIYKDENAAILERGNKP